MLTDTVALVLALGVLDRRPAVHSARSFGFRRQRFSPPSRTPFCSSQSRSWIFVRGLRTPPRAPDVLAAGARCRDRGVLVNLERPPARAPNGSSLNRPPRSGTSRGSARLRGVIGRGGNRPRHRLARGRSLVDLLYGALVLASSGRFCATRSVSCSREPHGGSMPRRSPRDGRGRQCARFARLHIWTITSASRRALGHGSLPPGGLPPDQACPRATARDRFRLTHHTLQVEPRRFAADRAHEPRATLESAPWRARGQDRGDTARRAESALRRHARSLPRVPVSVWARRVTRLEGDVAHDLDVTDPPAPLSSSSGWWRSSARSKSSSTRRACARVASRSTPVRDDDEGVVLDTNVRGLIRMTRLCLPHLRDGGHRSTSLGRRPPGVSGRLALRDDRSSPYAASRTAPVMICSGARFGSRTSHPGLVETDFSLVRFRGDEDKASRGSTEAWRR